MGEFHSATRPVEAVLKALCDNANPQSYLSQGFSEAQRDLYAQSLAILYAQLGPVFFGESSPEELDTFVSAALFNQIECPAFLLTELLRNFMLAYADKPSQATAMSVFNTLEGVAQTQRYRSPAIAKVLRHLDRQPAMPLERTAQIYPFKRRQPAGFSDEQ